MAIFVETPRLIIKTPSFDYFDELYQLQSDHDVMKYIFGGARSEERVKERLKKEIDHYQKHGFSMGPVFVKETNSFVGKAGILYKDLDDSQPDIEIGYLFHKSEWNKGYGTETTKTLVQWGFDHLPVKRIVAATHLENNISGHILMKAGLRWSGVKKYQEREAHFYEIERAT